MAIQQSVNQTIMTLAGINKVMQYDKQRMEQSIQSVEDIKLAKLQQKAQTAKYKAQIAKSRLSATQSKLKLKDLKESKKSDAADITIGGQKITDPRIIEFIKKGGAK